MTYKDILYIHAYIAFCYYEKSAMELITIEDAYRMYAHVRASSSIIGLDSLIPDFFYSLVLLDD